MEACGLDELHLRMWHRELCVEKLQNTQEGYEMHLQVGQYKAFSYQTFMSPVFCLVVFF